MARPLMLFDLDGTLLDDDTAEVAAINGWIHDAGFPTDVGGVATPGRRCASGHCLWAHRHPARPQSKPPKASLVFAAGTTEDVVRGVVEQAVSDGVYDIAVVQVEWPPVPADGTVHYDGPDVGEGR